MKKIVFAILAGWVLMLPTFVLANHVAPGCGMLGSSDLNSLAGVALVGVSVGIVLFSRRH